MRKMLLKVLLSAASKVWAFGYIILVEGKDQSLDQLISSFSQDY